MSNYQEMYQESLEQPDKFWAKAAENLHWFKPWRKVLDDTNAPFYKWFKDGECNICYNALDRHLETRPDQPALIYDSPVTDTKTTLTYTQLHKRVSHVAGAMADLGVQKGDRVLIYMPNMPESVIGMLACARIGAIHSVVFGGFAAEELATRINDAKPKVILSASCGIEPGRIVEYKPLLDKAIDISDAPPANVVVFQRQVCVTSMVEGRDLDWVELEEKASPVDCAAMEANDPLYILYTSGTTGTPKGVVHDHGGTMVALDWSMKHVYGTEPGDVFWAASDIGWVVGHSYMVYGPLVQGCTSVIYEGKPVGTPDATAFWRVMSEYKVNVFFTAPTAFRAIKKEDPKGELIRNFDLGSLKRLFLAGERADPATIHWAEDALNLPVIDHWWQTETGWPMAANPMGIEHFPIKYGSATKPVPGYDIKILDSDCNELPANETGAIVVKLPMPPGTLPTLWHNDQGYQDTYLTIHPGFYETKDAGYIDEDGYLFVMARTDDIINVAGHRLSTGGIEEIIAEHPDVAECAVIGPNDRMKGQVPFGFVVLNAGVDRPEKEIEDEVIHIVRDTLGPVASFKKVAIVARLPKTRSGKILRGTMKKISDAAAWKMPATIDDPETLNEITAALNAHGFPHD